ncbi:hypothetical protein HUW51_12145 [Adhaeribacter swui]|uniref:Uncharacterized protein n=1 Tax=Adhaeribacter swui TaxID=2086471 RepID=A0A7G7G8F0_9BACT|nr:hypothetical protein [Adhaeribacter swui]QNF33434.1 hypothetical protein HUW51_12145 [Adhaeribacter swui]
MDKQLDYHDAEITKLEYLIEKNELIIRIRTHNEAIYDLRFIEILGWEFSSFEIQNHLLDFRIYNSETLPAYILEEYEVQAAYLDLMKNMNGYLFELDPATGLGGYIIALDFQENKIKTLDN